MILLLGGTSDTAPLATRLAEAGFRVLVSTATDLDLEIGDHPNVHRRAGALDGEAMARLVRERGIEAILDAAHPYAEAAHLTARHVAEELALPLFRFERPSSVSSCDHVSRADNHAQAARIAFADGRPVLLTIGSRHCAPYAAEVRRTGVLAYARVLSRRESVQAWLNEGFAPNRIISEAPPHSLERNRAIIHDHGIGVIVTKDSGAAGGTPEKIEAARLEGCKVVVVRRPASADGPAFTNHDEAVDTVRKAVGKKEGG